MQPLCYLYLFKNILNMTTFREAVYMVLDLLKQISDDAYYTEEHILFLLSKVRATLIKKKYSTTRNQPFQVVDKANYQEIRFDLEPNTSLGPGRWYQGYINDDPVPVPRILPVGQAQAFVDRNVRNERVSVVLPERLRFVGYNKWLRPCTYCSVSDNNRFQVRQLDDTEMQLNSMVLFAIYENCLESTPLSCDPVDEEAQEFLDKRFPLEEQLMAQCIELVVQEVTGSKWQPQDRHNNAKDDMSDMAVRSAAQTPVTTSAQKNE